MAKKIRLDEQGRPPIYTADNHEIEIGDILFGVDTHCRNGGFPTITPLEVLHLDLTSRRTVRMRLENGVEWTWSPNQSKGTCKTGDQLLYLDFELAKKAAIEVAETHGEGKEIEEARQELKYAQEEVTEREDALKKLLGDAKNFPKQIAALRKAKRPAKLFV